MLFAHRMETITNRCEFIKHNQNYICGTLVGYLISCFIVPCHLTDTSSVILVTKALNRSLNNVTLDLNHHYADLQGYLG